MKENYVLKNVSWIIICRLMQAVFALIINALTARYFGPSNYGVISYAASLVAFVTPIMKLGTGDILVNEIIKTPKEEGEILGTSITMTTVSSVACMLGLLSFVKIANHNDLTTIYVTILYSTLLLSQSLEQIQYSFHAKYLSKIVSITSLIVYLLISLYKIFLLVTEKSIYWFAVSNAIDHFIIATVLFAVYKIKGGQRLFFSSGMLERMWGNGKHYIIPEMMGLVLQQSDIIMLRFMYGEKETGLYSAALSVATLTSFVFAAIITSFRPLVLESKVSCRKKFEYYMVKIYGIIIYLALLQIIFIIIFGRFTVKILYGEEFIASVPMLNIAIWYTLFSYIGSVRTLWILAEEKQKFLWIISFFGMIANVLLNAVLISWFGGEGAALATVITQIITNIVIVYLVKPLRINIKYIFNALNIRKWIIPYVE